MKVVIIAYQIYPQNSPRSNRATELAKEFGRKGCDVALYGVLGKYDYTNFEKKYNIKIKNLGNFYFSKFDSDENNSEFDYFITRALSKLIGKWFYFPLIGLYHLVYKALKKEKDIDLLITVAYPFPIHWGAALFKSFHKRAMDKTTWVADCGDPFMGNPLNKFPYYFKYIEKWFCRKTDFLTIPIVDAKEAYYPEFQDKIRIIPQGFNMDEFKPDGLYIGNDIPTFLYAGVFYPGVRDPRPFLDYLSEKKINFKFIIYTRSVNVIEPYMNLLGSKLVIRDYIPRSELLVEMSKADFLINFENNTSKQSPSKLIDYALTNRPILSINSNESINVELVNNFLSGDYSKSFKIVNIEQYDIQNIVKQFISLKRN